MAAKCDFVMKKAMSAYTDNSVLLEMPVTMDNAFLLMMYTILKPWNKQWPTITGSVPQNNQITNRVQIN